MGFLDRAKKMAEQAKDLAEGALADAGAKRGAADATPASSGSPTDVRLGTPYVPGILGRPGWRERGLTDPAAVLPIDERDRAGVPRSTKSEIVEEPFGMGRRWSAAGRSTALFYQLYPEHQAWEPPGGAQPWTEVGGSTATLPDGRSLVFLGTGERRVVLEVNGIDTGHRADLARSVVEHLGA
jgi:hypothetical protein